MLTTEQQNALDEACNLYTKARTILKDDNAGALQLFNDAFGILIDYIDEVDDIYYRLVFANCIEELQRKGDLDFSPVIIQVKTDIYKNVLAWALDATEYNTNFKVHLWIAFDALARLYLLGEEGVSQDDNLAYVCYQCEKMFGFPMADIYLEDFVQDSTTGTWNFIGVKPQ